MRILLLSPQPFFRIRGTPINIRNVITALCEAGHEVDLLCYPFGEDESIPGLTILRSPRIPGIGDVAVGPSPAKIPLDAAMAAKTFLLLLRGRYDVVHAVEESAFFAAWYNRWIFRRPALIYDMDSCISDQLRYTGALRWGPLLKLVEWMERKAIRRSAFVLTVCRSLSDTVRRLVPDAEIVQIEDAPLEDEFVPDEEGAARLRRAYGPGRFVVYTGNLESYQGVDLLIRAAVLVRQPCTFLIAGGTVDQVRAMRRFADEIGATRVHFAGSRPLAEMPAHYTLAHVLASPRVEGGNTALKVYTYMQTGRPIVATDLDTHTQVLDASCAVLVPPEPAAFAAGIDRALSDPDAARLGRAAREKVQANYALPRFKRRVVEAYERLSISRPA